MRERADAYLPHKVIHLAACRDRGGGVSAVPRCRRAVLLAANFRLGVIMWTTPLDEQRIDAGHSQVSTPPNLGKLAYSPISRCAPCRPPGPNRLKAGRVRGRSDGTPATRRRAGREPITLLA
jgi:hypothetical protein